MTLGLTLRFRIISLVALLAVVLIAAFSILLVTRQLQFTTEYNSYRGRVGTFAAKGRLEIALLASLRSGDTAAFEKVLSLLKKSQLADAVSVADLTGKVVASTHSFEVGSPLRETDAQWAKYALNAYSSKNWYLVQVNSGEIVFYTPITVDEAPRYIAILRYSLGNMQQAIEQVKGQCILIALGVLAGIIPLSLLLIQAILGPIRILNQATKDIAAGNFAQKVDLQTPDELGELAETFNQMTLALTSMKARAENANPLTRLPGNNMIQEEIDKRIKAKEKFVAVYSDLDNFKAFNDKYGIAAGDQAIQLTAQIMREAMKKGSGADFLGHEGGDDFFILTTPEKAEGVTNAIATEFDCRIRKLYSPEDLVRGHITSKDREGNVKEFPLMTISLAGVTNIHRPLTSYAHVTNICAEVKKKAKSLSKTSGKSTFYLDRRTDESNMPQTS